VSPTAPPPAVSDSERIECQTFARREAEVVRRHATWERRAERESFERDAAARISAVESLGYGGSRDGSPAVDAQVVNPVLVVALVGTAIEALVRDLRWAVDTARREELTEEAVMTDCLRAAATADGPEPDPLEMARTLHRLGLRYLAHGRYAEAERLFWRALAIRGQDVFATHTAVAASLHSLVALYHARGQYAEAERLQVSLRPPIPDDRRTPVQWAAFPCAALAC
jgi:hypothetical protein